MRYSDQTYRVALASLAALRETLSDEERLTLDFVAEAIAEKADRDCLPPPAGLVNEPLTQSDLDKLHFERVWIDYGPDEEGGRCGEEGVVLYGRLYSIDTLDGAGLEALILDAGCRGETLDNPSGPYTVYRRPPEQEGGENHGKADL